MAGRCELGEQGPLTHAAIQQRKLYRKKCWVQRSDGGGQGRQGDAQEALSWLSGEPMNMRDSWQDALAEELYTAQGERVRWYAEGWEELWNNKEVLRRMQMEAPLYNIK
eukprot:1158847-Pelagomonas_calceolata.AAC.7